MDQARIQHTGAVWLLLVSTPSFLPFLLAVAPCAEGVMDSCFGIFVWTHVGQDNVDSFILVHDLFYADSYMGRICDLVGEASSSQFRSCIASKILWHFYHLVKTKVLFVVLRWGKVLHSFPGLGDETVFVKLLCGGMKLSMIACQYMLSIDC